jgi:lipid-A-disaccharide synthase
MEGMIRSVFFIAGELSADRYAARLLEALRKRNPGLRAEAIGGPNLRAAGVPLLRDSSAWSAIGVAEALRRIPPIWLGLQSLKRKLRRDPPDLLLPLDFGAFNVPAANYARKLGVPVCYVIPPGSWRPDGGRVSKRLASCADSFLTPFRPSEKTLRSAGLEADFLGHPLLDFLPETGTRERLRASFELTPDAATLGILPGSRGQELRYLTPALLDAAISMRSRIDGLELILPLAPSLPSDALDPLLKRRGWSLQGESAAGDGFPVRRYAGPMNLVLLQGRALDALAVADAALVCSGTATLEAALAGCPIVIGYRGGGATVLEYVLRKSIVPDTIGLPNLLLKRRLCPELIQETCVPERLAEEALPLLRPSERRETQLQGFRELRGQLGETGVIDRWAERILARFGGGRSASAVRTGGKSA